MLQAWSSCTQIAYIFGAEAEKCSTLHQTQFKAFKANQKEYPHSLFMLRDAELLVPVINGNDINAPNNNNESKGEDLARWPSKLETMRCLREKN